MSLNVEVGTLAAPVATGNQTYTLLTAGFGQVKALILWAAYNTAEGDVDGNAIFSLGFGTYRGSTPQRFVTSFFDTDAVATTDTARTRRNDNILYGFSDATPTVDYAADLVSLGNAQFVLNWSDVPPSQIRINFLALGGSDITDALADWPDVTQTVGQQDITVASGFGQPDLLITMASIGPANVDANGNNYLGLGLGVDDSHEVHSMYNARDNRAGVDVASHQTTTLMAILNSSASLNYEVELVSRSSWPTDGFRINKLSPPVGADQPLINIALRGTFSKKVGVATVPTATAPQAQDLSLGNGAAPRGALFFHNSVPASSGIESTNSDLATFGIGAMDGTREVWAGVGNTDASATSLTHRNHSESKAIKMYTPSAAGTLASEADSSFAGDGVRLTWSDTDTVARQYCYLILGDAPTSGTSIALPRHALGGGRW